MKPKVVVAAVAAVVVVVVVQKFGMQKVAIFGLTDSCNF